MEQRKLIRLGNSSFAIALPKQWVDSSGLKKGDKIFVERNGNGELLLSSELKKKEVKQVSLDLSSLDETSLQVELIRYYLQDYGVFRIKNNMPHQKKQHIKELIKNLMSFEIMEDNNEELKLKDMFNLSEIDVKSFVRRIDNILRSFFEDLDKTINDGKASKHLYKEMAISDKEITRIYFLIGKIFMKSLNDPSLLNSLKVNYTFLFRSWWITFHLEQIGDELKYIVESFTKNNKAESKVIKPLFEKIKTNYFECMNSYYKGDFEKLKNIVFLNKEIVTQCDKLAQKGVGFAQTLEKFKKIENSIFQNSKMILYTQE